MFNLYVVIKPLARLAVFSNFLEIPAKDFIDQRSDLKKFTELFCKTLQNLAAANALIILGLLFVKNPLVMKATCVIGSAIVLTPIINAFVQKSDKENLKKVMQNTHQAINVTAKMINIAVGTMGIFIYSGVLMATLGGIGLTAISFLNLNK